MFRIVWLFTTGMMVLAFTGCSGESTPPPASGTNSPAAVGSQAAATALAATCPLRVDQVSAAVGEPVKGPDSSCSFYPADEARVRPNVTYVRQVSIACSGTVPAENGYTEKADGFDVTAYVNDQADGSYVLVCRGNQPFEVRVDMAGAEAARRAAISLARQVLDRP